MIRDAWRKVRRYRDAARREETGGMRPENLVWVFGTARTGSSWLSAIMGEIGGYSRWHEPLVGHLFGNLYYECRATAARMSTSSSGPATEISGSAPSGGSSSTPPPRFPRGSSQRGKVPDHKEPQGSMGAPLLMEALPESRA